MVTMAERVKNIEDKITKIDMCMMNQKEKNEIYSGKLDLILTKIDNLPEVYVPRKEFSIYIKIAGFIAGALLLAVIGLIFQILQKGI